LLHGIEAKIAEPDRKSAGKSSGSTIFLLIHKAGSIGGLLRGAAAADRAQLRRQRRVTGILVKKRIQ
jgi:hypothetical protein